MISHESHHAGQARRRARMWLLAPSVLALLSAVDMHLVDLARQQVPEVAGMKHLWEVDHPYYCSESNFYKNGTRQTYESWAEFIEGDPYYDLDMNLLFRWDWHIDPEDRHHTLELFWMLQRKGIFRSDSIAVMPADEPAVRVWLEPRWHKMIELWRPLP